ncbi:MAG: aldehyde ferredoxin oxidoreductase family protein [Acidilobaceae archaeon]
MPGGYVGRIAFIDLSKQKYHIEPLNMTYARLYIGGKGIAARYLLDYLPRGVDPLSPDNLLVVMTCPANGTAAPASPKYPIVTKSPLTGYWLDTHSGGAVGVELKYAGFDGVIISGKADKPLYLYIEDGKIEFRRANHLWGLRISDTRRAIKEELGDPQVKVLSIGPAGEKLVKYAIIDSEGRQHGRGGAGAVMGSKNLKAIAVRGSGRVEVALPREFENIVEEMEEKDIFKNPEAEFGIKWGSISLGWFTNEAGALPTRNFQTGSFELWSGIDALAVARVRVKRAACRQCPIGCHNVILITSGKYAGTLTEGPEYETASLLGSNLGIGDIGALAKLNYLADELGLDTISLGGVLGWATELYERGIISIEETGGLDLRFGNDEAYVVLTEAIAYRKTPLADILAEGTRRACERIGRDSCRYAVHVKGLELPAYDPRAAPAMGLSYAVADRGGDHLRSWPIGPEVLGRYWLGAKPIAIERWSPDNKAIIVVQQEHQYAAKFAAGVCDFCCWDNERLGLLIYAVTGFEEYKDVKGFELAGERIVNLIRVFNVREGMTARDDILPPRIHEDPHVSGLTKNRVLPREWFEKMKREYYEIRGWDTEGRPTIDTLKRVGVDEGVLKHVTW